MDQPAISVLICSHNPRPVYLGRVLEALRAQTLPPAQWELLLIDNASTPPLAGRFNLSWHPRGRVWREERVGKTQALLLGIRQSHAPLLVIVDDDNVLAPDYLGQAMAIGAAHPRLGAWGGNVTLQFETPPPAWTRHYWPFLAEQPVTAPATACNLELEAPLPVGAGCCVRREVAERYAAQVSRDPWRQRLGRTGTSLMACEDADMVLTACELGFGRGLFPAMRLTHLIAPERLSEDYLRRLVAGIRFSHYLLDLTRNPRAAPPPINWWWWLKLGCDCLFKFGRKRRFYLANKWAQREARGVYESTFRCPKPEVRSPKEGRNPIGARGRRI